MADKKLQPIIVKRIKKQAHAAHGGAWKIAYADFVTAMMAFFLLMWLLGSTAKGELQGIAAYFNSPLQVAMAGGNGAGNSSSIIPGGGNDLSKVHGQVRRSDSDAEKKSRISPEAAKAEVAKQDAKRMQALQAKIESLITESPKLKEYKSQIRMEITPDGLQIQIVDDQNRPMFDSGSALVKPYMRELSADRANASRRELVAAGMPDAKLVRVVGLAASDLMEPDKPNAPINRRISITVMTREAESRLLGNGHKSAPAAAEIADVIQEADRLVAPAPVQGLPSAAPPVPAVADAARPADAAAAPRTPAPLPAPPAR